jgi:tRNA (guanine-N7-)-methyltransferase
VDYCERVLDLDALFGRKAARTLEIGFGNGDTLLALAVAQPESDFLGVEVHEPGVGRVLLRAAQLGLTNLRVSRHDAVEVLEQQIPPASLQQILIFFPDPWPKSRHHKRRLIQPAFAGLLASRLQAGGSLRLATDWQNYAEQMLEVLNACPQLRNCSADNGYVPRPDSRPPTRFELRGQRLGHNVWDLAFRRE